MTIGKFFNERNHNMNNIRKRMIAIAVVACMALPFAVSCSSNSVGKIKVSFNTLSIVGEAGIKYKLNNSFFLRAGAKVAFPFDTAYKSKLTIGSTTTKGEKKYSGFMFNITPFVGGAYLF